MTILINKIICLMFLLLSLSSFGQENKSTKELIHKENIDSTKDQNSSIDLFYLVELKDASIAKYINEYIQEYKLSNDSSVILLTIVEYSNIKKVYITSSNLAANLEGAVQPSYYSLLNNRLILIYTGIERENISTNDRIIVELEYLMKEKKLSSDLIFIDEPPVWEMQTCDGVTIRKKYMSEEDEINCGGSRRRKW
jgi:hypothetical protein